MNLLIIFLLLLSKLRPILSVNMSKMQPAGNALTDLKDFGYQFNGISSHNQCLSIQIKPFLSISDQGQLRKFDKITNTITNETFQFEVSSNSDTNQKNYEALGEIITKCVYQLLIDFGLHKIYLPSDVAENEANFVFCTKPNLTDVRQLIVIIHGSGVVRAGQWSRSLIINQSIDHGTQIPYIKKAIELGYDVLITNTNNNFFLNQNGQHVKIVGNESPVEHGSLVWKQLILPANGIKSVAIVAHSYGGVVTLSLMRKFPEFFKEKCFAICFTDSVHSIGSLPSDLVQLAKKVCGD